MGASIHILPEVVASRIAAGEVVERPASVVKELMENALDAGSTEIVISIEESGSRSIEISDNGRGMGEEDALLAFERHATSKIKSADELAALTSFGFRGEALPSIASVSDITLLTSDEGGEATEITLRGGHHESEGKRSRTRGTTVSVRNLFYNTPARRKFMKSAQAEERQIRRVVIAHALSQVDTAFRYLRDGEEVFHLVAGEDLKARITRLFGHDFARELVEVEGSEKGPVISGYVSNIDAHRGNRNYQYFAVNRRPVQQALLTQAITVAFRDCLPPRRFPSVFLSIDIDPSYVDVNIHPTKREVRFSPERTVFSAIQGAVRRAIRSEESLPSFWQEKGGAAAGQSPSGGGAGGGGGGSGSGGVTARETRLPLPAGGTAWTYHDNDAPIGEHRGTATTGTDGGEPGTAPPPESWIETLDLNSIHQVGLTFLVASGPDRIVVVDQHTAHERILFEEVRARMAKSGGDSQQLLIPETLEVDPEAMTVIEEYSGAIEKAGFALRPAGPRSVLLEGVPTGLRNASPTRFLHEFLEGLTEEGRGDRSRSRHVAATVACHGAIRAGDSLTPEERRGLLLKLIRCEQPLRCPHGRPTFLSITLTDLARRFQRE